MKWSVCFVSDILHPVVYCQLVHLIIVSGIGSKGLFHYGWKTVNRITSSAILVASNGTFLSSSVLELIERKLDRILASSGAVIIYVCRMESRNPSCKFFLSHIAKLSLFDSVFCSLLLERKLIYRMAGSNFSLATESSPKSMASLASRCAACLSTLLYRHLVVTSFFEFQLPFRLYDGMNTESG